PDPAAFVTVRERLAPEFEIHAVAAHEVLLGGVEQDRMFEEEPRLHAGCRRSRRAGAHELVAEHGRPVRTCRRWALPDPVPGAVGSDLSYPSAAAHSELAPEQVEDSVHRWEQPTVPAVYAEPILGQPKHLENQVSIRRTIASVPQRREAEGVGSVVDEIEATLQRICWLRRVRESSETGLLEPGKLLRVRRLLAEGIAGPGQIFKRRGHSRRRSARAWAAPAGG